MIKILEKPNLIFHLILIFVAFAFGGIVSVLGGKELAWDTMSYHAYNPYAILHNRWNMDYWHGSYIQVFLNPTIDFVSYFLVKYLTPFMASFVLGGIHGLNLWIMFGICYLLVSKYEKEKVIFISLVLAMIGIYGAISFGEMGSFMGDNLVSLFILSFVWLFLLYNEQKNSKFLWIGGLFLGIGIGLKLALAYTLVGTFFATLLVPKFNRLEIFFILLLSSAIGFLLVQGYWMIFLWEHYHNPFFPFFNQIFQSEYFPNINWRDERYIPKTLLNKLFYPFFFFWNGQASDSRFFDFRFPMLYLLYLIFCFYWLKNKILNEKPEIENQFIWLVLFYLFSYITWQFAFGHIRYFLPFQILTPLVMYLILRYCINDFKLRMRYLWALMFFIAYTMIPMKEIETYWWGKDYYGVNLPEFINKYKTGYVLMLHPNLLGKNLGKDIYISKITTPVSTQVTHKDVYKAISVASMLQTYLIPYFPPDFHFLGITTVVHNYAVPKKVKEIISNSNGPFFIITARPNMPSFLNLVAKEFGLNKKTECGIIQSDRIKIRYTNYDSVLICGVTKS